MLGSAMLLMTSCGGGQTSSGIAPVVATAPTSTPTPTPSPTATPTPTPISYASATDFTRDRSFTAIGCTIQFGANGSNPLVATLDQESSAIGFDFTAATRIYRARYNAASITAATQSVLATDPPYDDFTGPSGSFRRLPLIIGTTSSGKADVLAYVGYVSWYDSATVSGTSNTTLRYLLFGGRTLASDIPTSGKVTLSGYSTLTSSFASGGSGDTASFSIDYAARTIVGTTAFYPASTGGTGSSTRPRAPAQPISFSGILDPATGRISGTAIHTDSGSVGKVEGALYGPAGAEIGLLMSITTSDGQVYYGVIGARK